MMREKRLSKGGSLTIPADLRRELGIGEGEKFKVEVAPKGEILLSRIDGSCIACGSSEELRRIEKIYLCRGCYEKMKEVFEDDR